MSEHPGNYYMLSLIERRPLSAVDPDEGLVTLDQITVEIASLGYVARA